MLSFKKWNIMKYNRDQANIIAEEYGYDAVIAIMLSAKGITDKQEIDAFFSDENELIDPFTLPDMDIAVERIGTALDNGEKIAVFGDFDADGITSTALLYLYLTDCGGDVQYYIPDRNKEGYGLNKAAIDAFHSDGVSLIITVDNGIAAADEVNYANEIGIDVVITDHHMQSDFIPNAVAVVNPHRRDSICKYCEWAGVGVTFKLVCALNGDEDEIIEKYSDLTAIGTIADVVSVCGENRILIKKGLKKINASKRLGIVALKGVSGMISKTIDSVNLAFGICPRINAAGRMGSAERAVKLLITEDGDEAVRLAEEISQANSDRIDVETEMFNDADEYIHTHPEILYDRILVLSGKGWNPGVGGIVASKLVEKYGKPCIVISETDDDTVKGSCRSINGFSIFEALSSASSLLEQFGGHTLAAGFSIKKENIDDFRIAVNDYAEKMFHNMPVPQIDIDFKLNPASVNLNTLESLNAFQPFGTDNTKPVLGLYKMEILNITSVSGNKHVKLTLFKNGVTIQALYFNHSSFHLPFMRGDIVNCAVTLEKNEYYGRVNVSVFIKDIKLSVCDDDDIISGRQLFNNFMTDNLSDGEIDRIAVERDDIAIVYRWIKHFNGWGYSYEDLYIRMNVPSLNFAQFLISVEIMKQIGVIIEDTESGRLDLPIEAVKMKLTDSEIYNKMCSLATPF